jgi:hypothetical protein
MPHVEGSAYCYYHDKLQRGLLEPHVDTKRVEVEEFDQSTGKRTVKVRVMSVTRTDCYPVYPLTPNGYVLLPAHERAA